MTRPMLETLAGRPVRRVMVVAAHPDDEVVGAGAQLGQWPDVHVVHVTNGSPRDRRFAEWAGFADPAGYATARRLEAIAALALVGIPPGQIVALGFDDQDAATLLPEITAALQAVVQRCQPDVVVTHPYEGGHPDHDSVCFAVHQAVANLRNSGCAVPAVLEMTSYFGRGGERVVSEFLAAQEDVIGLPLSVEQRLLKRRMYERFTSQYPLLSQFPLEVERFRRAPPYDFRRKPVAGEVFYDNFELGTTSGQWIARAAAAIDALGGRSIQDAGATTSAAAGNMKQQEWMAGLTGWKTDRPKIGAVDFGDFRRVEPISISFGYDRGTPIDRLYIEDFLERHRGDVRGRVLEVGDNAYTLRYGGDQVSHSDVLHVNPAVPGVTIAGDIAAAPQIPSGVFDCIILTQVLELVYDLRSAVNTIYRILKPGGVVLITVPGISNIDYGEWNDLWMWSFTVASMKRLLAERFTPENIAVESCGNVFAAVSFLHGLSLEDIAAYDHQQVDPHYQVTILARAVRGD